MIYDTADPKAVVLRWAYCRCAYSRAPLDPCRCIPGDRKRAERETPAQTRRWERVLLERAGR